MIRLRNPKDDADGSPIALQASNVGSYSKTHPLPRKYVKKLFLLLLVSMFSMLAFAQTESSTNSTDQVGVSLPCSVLPGRRMLATIRGRYRLLADGDAIEDGTVFAQLGDGMQWRPGSNLCI